MRAQHLKKLVGLFSVMVGLASVPLITAPPQAASSNRQGVAAVLDYDTQARQDDERYLRSHHAARQQRLAHKKRILLYRLRQQEREAKAAARRQFLLGGNDVPLSTRLAQIDRAFEQQHAQLERSLAEEQAQEQAALDLERELSRIPD
jgi:hypothetical protein